MSLATFSPHPAQRSKESSPNEDESSSQHTIPTIGQLFILESSSPIYHRQRPITSTPQHLYVLPVLFLEFLAIALTRAVLPHILLKEYGSRVYLVLGCADCIRGLLAFFACPLFGKLSDALGRRVCLLITVIGTCAPSCSLAFFSWEDQNDEPSQGRFLDDGGSWPTAADSNNNMTMTTTIPSSSSSSSSSSTMHYSLPPTAIPLFVVLLSLSGIFSSTFTLVFAYISDTVKHRGERVSAYGLALATFGLSFTIGPMAGGYLAQSNTHYVFVCSLVLTILDVLYIFFILPESRPNTISSSASAILFYKQGDISLSPWESINLIMKDPFLRRVGEVAFFYYTGLWAVISTLSLYAVQHFGLTPERLGELMSALGLSTMIAEAVLVRVLVPLIGEKRSTRLGLLSFMFQCLILGFAYEGWHLFVCVAFSLMGNLVYPSLSSLVSSTVEPEMVGEALGAVNGVKALTEGLGPLIFGAMMTVSEHSTFPGWPYWVASGFVMIAYNLADKLPDVDHDDDDDDEYIHELEFKQRSAPRDPSSMGCLDSAFATPTKDDEHEEYKGLLSLSEVDESEEDENR